MTAAEVAAERRRTTVLIVDDGHNSRESFSRLLNPDIEVLTCTSAEEAERLFEERNGNIGVIISDHRLPTTTGVSLLTRVKERWPDTVRLLTSGYADTDSVAASVGKARCEGFDATPWTLEALSRALDDASTCSVGSTSPGEDIGSSGCGAARWGASGLPPLVGVLSHELASPLLSIEMTSNALIASARAASGPEAEGRLQSIVQAAERISEDAARARRLVRSLAELARDTAHPSSFTRVSMHYCIEEAVAAFPFSAQERERVTLVLAGDFDFLGSDVLMMAVVTNLVSNALDAIRPLPAGAITIQTSSHASHNSVVVRDTGSGVASGMADEVFHPFVSSKSDGSGLGLAICDWIVRSFGGTIKPTAPAGSPTTVEVRLPRPMPQAAL